MHSLQDFDEKKCEKISFAPILSPHSIAKSGVNPIFSPPPHPSFFAPKSPFFPLFPVSNPISGDLSRDRARFLPCEVHFFIVLPRFASDCGRFFEGTSLFSAPKLTFSLLFPVFPHASGTSSRDLTHYFLRKYFSDSALPFLHPLLHLPISIDFLSAPLSPLPSPLPHFLSHSSPLFHLPPQ